MNTPFFPAFRARLAARGRRTTGPLRQTTLRQLAAHLADLIPLHLLSTADEGPNSRERLFTLRLTCECFVWQMLKPRTACREVVRQVQALACLHGREAAAENASAYIQARQRLPQECLERVLAATAQAAERRAASSPRLQGRPVKVVDGSSVQLPDTPANQKAYPQPSGQKPGCGFPVLKLGVLFSLASGALLDVVMGHLHQHDLRLFHRLWEALKAGDILLGDRAYGDYVTLAGLPRQGVDVVARLHQACKVYFRRAKRLGHHDGVFTWRKGCMQSTILTPAQWAALPDQIQVRILRFTAACRGFRTQPITLVTTLLDAELYPAAELIALYLRRWRIELGLRDVKTTLGLEQLRCQSPAMVRKELLAGLIAHNLIRCVLAEAAQVYEAELERLSFKGAVDALRQYSAVIAQARTHRLKRKLWENLLRTLAGDRVPLRPGRTEPRAVKRRPKPFPLLNRPRRQFVELPHRNSRWHGGPRKFQGLN
ncbi:MAG: IS4 family transposase [Verrucomicrobiae bacterium]|nr:IS4 family transposase [Verrucomicrobiae bacterium]